MKTTLLKISLLIFIAYSTLSCSVKVSGTQGKGPVIEKEFAVNDEFNALQITSGWEAELIQSDSPRVVVKTEENLMNLIDIKVVEGKLIVTNRENIGTSKSRVVKVYYTDLNRIHSSSGARIYSSDTFEQQAMNLSVSSGAKIELLLKTGELTAAADSGGKMLLSGTSLRLFADSTSGSTIKASELKTQESEAQASSGGKISLYALKSLNAHTTSGGSISYSGNPETEKLNQSISGGSIRKK